MNISEYAQYSSSWLLLSTFITVSGSSMLMGYNIAVLNSPTKIIIAFYNETYISRGDDAMSEGMLQLLWSLTVSVYVCAGMVGGYSCGFIADYFGRKKGLLFNNIFMFLGALLEGLSKPLKAPEMLILGRLFIGINCGMTVGLSSLYLTEIAPKQIRGAIGSCHQLGVTTGILLAQVMGMRQVLGTERLWPVLCAISALPAALMIAVLPFCPESPRYLLLKRKDREGAVKALQILRKRENVSDEIEEMTREAKENQVTGLHFRFFQLFSLKELRKPVMVAIVIQVTQAWSGINAIFFYSESIFAQSGLSHDHIPYAIVGTGLVNVIITLLAVHLVEKLGRRTLLLGPMGLMILASVIITVSLNLQFRYEWMAYVSMSCVFLFIIGFSLGLGSIPPLITAELFRQEPRPSAMALGQGVNWTCNFILAMSFNIIHKGLHAYTFLVFFVVLSASAVFIYFVIPETMNRTFDEIAKDLELGTVSRSASRMSTRLFFRDGHANGASAATTPVSPTSENIEFNSRLNAGNV